MALDLHRLRVVIDGDNSGAEKAIKQTDTSVEQFTRDASGRLRDVNGQFVKTGEAAGGMAGKVEQATSGISSSLSNMASTAQLAIANFAGNMLSQGVAQVQEFAHTAIKNFGDLQQGVANISTIAPKIDTTQVFDSLNQMQMRVPQTAAQLSDSLYDIFSSVNVTQKEGLQLVEEFARGATGAGTDAQTFGTSVMGVMNAYKLSVSDAKHISDLFFNTVNAGVVTGQELASSLGPVTQAAKAAGQSTNTLFAAIAAVTKEGGPAQQNINNLNNLFSKLTTDKAVSGLKELGVQVSDNGKFRNIVDILADMKKKLDPLPPAIQAAKLNDIFPDEQARHAAQVLWSQLDTLREQIKVNATEAGSAAAAFEKMSGTFKSQSQLLQNSFSAVATQVGAEILPAITPFISALAKDMPNAVQTVKTWFAQFKVSAEDAFKPFKPLINDIVSWFRENFPLIQKTVQTVLATVAEFWRDHGEEIIGVLRAMFAVISGILKTLMQVINGDWRGAFETAKQVVENFGEYVFRSLAALGNIIIDAAIRLGTAALGAGKAIVDGLIEGIKGGQNAVWDAANVLAGGIPNIVRSILQIHSPSRVFHQIGVDVGQGFINGLASMQALINVTVMQMVQAVESARAKVRDMLHDSQREMLVAKYGENSAPVIRFDNPALPRNEAINAAATIAKNKTSIQVMADYERHLQSALEAGAEYQADQDKDVADLMFGAVEAYRKQQIDTVKDIVKQLVSVFQQGFPLSSMPLQAAAATKTTTTKATTTKASSSDSRSANEELIDNLVSDAMRSGKQFLQALLGGGSMNRKAAIQSLLGDMQQSLTNMVSDTLMNSFKPNMERIAKDIGGTLQLALRGIDASVMRMLSEVYSLLAIVGAQGKKKQTGGIIGAALGGLAAIFTGGAALPLITAGAALGSFAADPDLGGGLNVAAALGGAGYFSGAASRSSGGSYDGYTGKYVVAGDSRAVNVTNNVYGGVHNAADLDQLTGSLVDAVTTGLRTK